jgi:Malectin domain/Bacterial Ig-like domain/Kelch motif/Abnormal spindle-like microcephaly-assoc'd, ASPM-SPD-2-Hydin
LVGEEDVLTKSTAATLGRVLLAFLIVATVIVVLPAGAAEGATPLYRVNAGGPALTGTPSWQADTSTNPSSYVNASATGNYTFSTTQAIDMTDPSVPSSTPQALFQTERWDPAGGAEMHWSFPVSPGRYQVRLYFAEIYSGAQSVGARVFNVSIEGAPVLTNYDIFADVGGYRGVVKSFFVSSDSTLDVEFAHVVENPKVAAIEILPGTRPNELGVSPESLDFGNTAVGSSQSKPVELTNLGASGDPSVIVQSTAISGPDASSFSDSFDDTAGVTLAPGQSTTISARFAPTTAGAKSATLTISHSGANTPLTVPLAGSGATGAPPGTWETRAPTGLARQEVAYVNAGGKLYLAGGGTAQQVYDPATDSWGNVAPLPASLDHIQSVELGGKIYYIGGLLNWPSPEVDTVYIYNPATNSFSQGAKMPRPRGAGGVAVYNGKIYYAGGLNGGVAVPWFDVYDPAANTWSQLPNMPTARDHFQAAIVNGKFYAIGGRNVDINATTPVNEAFNFATGSWQTGLAPLPTPRGGFAAAALGDEILIIGGEGAGTTYSKVEAYNTVTNSWRTLAPMPTARHGIEAAVCNGGVYIAAGGTTAGGSTPTQAHEVFFLGSPTPCGATPVGFGKSALAGASSTSPTSLEFGPDGRLYVAQQNGLIKAYTISRQSANSYAVTATETISAIQSIVNHNDDGTVNTSITTRQVTGLLVRGTAANPVIYVGSSDPRIGGDSSGQDTGLDTNSSTISRLTWNGTSWQKLDLVRGLPRSEENHSVNGLQLDPVTNTLYVAVGGNTNEGAPSNNFALLPEYALSAAILAIDLNAIGNTTYDLPTLDDDTRTGTSDANDPFGGNDGKNQAKLVSGGPVQVYAPGFRNSYDLAITTSGRMYTIDNGGNAGWGDVPLNEGPAGVCTNGVNEPGLSEPDELHFVSGRGYYGGHPNPTRGNKANTFNADHQSPVVAANAIECDYLAPGAARKALTTWPASTNGLAEYTASNFGGAMTGDLLAASFDNKIYRIKLNAAGDAAVANQALFSTVGNTPLDVTSQPNGAKFPGTIWVADHGDNTIYVFEPNDFGGGGGACSGADDPALDEDGDGYKNADEIDNSTNPCSAADFPPDWDHDFVSNLNDPNDDNDTLPDTSDPFAIDPSNGTGTTLPVRYTWDNNAPPAGGLLNLGFTGLMTNGSSNYSALFDPANMTAGGAAGVTTVDKVPDGDAYLTNNNQQYGFQFGVKTPATTFTLHTRIVSPFAGLQPADFQSMGMFLGNGDQDNYLKLVVSANGGAGGVELLKEVAGSVSSLPAASVSMPGPDAIDLFLTVDPGASTVQASYTVITGGVTGPRNNLGPPQAIPQAWLGSSSRGLAVGMISTSRGAAPEFPATWDLIEVEATDATPPTVTSVSPKDGATGVAPNAKVSATFSEAMNAATVNATTFTLVKQGTTSPIAATVKYDGTALQAVLTSNAKLEAGAIYIATVKGGAGGVKDAVGNPMAADKTWSFTVRCPRC